MLSSLSPTVAPSNTAFSPVSFSASKRPRRPRRGQPNYMAAKLAAAEAAWRPPKFADMPQFPLADFETILPANSPLRLLGAQNLKGAMTTWFGRNSNVLKPLISRVVKEFPNGARMRNHGSGEKSPLYLSMLLLGEATATDPQAQDAINRQDASALAQRECELMLKLQQRYPRTSVDLSANVIDVLRAGQFRISDPRDLAPLQADSDLAARLMRHAKFPEGITLEELQLKNMGPIFQLRPTARHALGRVKHDDVIKDAKTMPPVDLMFAENVATYVLTQNPDPAKGARVASDYVRGILRKVSPKGYAIFGMSDVVDPSVAGKNLTFSESTRRIIQDEGFEAVPDLPHARTQMPPGTPPTQIFSGPVVFRRKK